MIRRFPNVNKARVRIQFYNVFRHGLEDSNTTYSVIYTTMFPQVNIFFERVSVNAVIAPIFQPGMRNWSVGVSGGEIEVFDRKT